MIELYGHPLSGFTWKARIALLAHGTDHVFKMVDAGHPDNTAFVAAAHPAGLMPVLREGGTVVVEASAIIEWLAVTHRGDAPLVPVHPGEAAAARMIDRVFDLYVLGNVQRLLAARHKQGAEPDEAAAAAAEAGLRRACDWLEGWLGDNRLPNHFSLASCAAAPALFYADWVMPLAERTPRLAALRAELVALDPVVACINAARPYRRLFPGGAPARD